MARLTPPAAVFVPIIIPPSALALDVEPEEMPVVGFDNLRWARHLPRIIEPGAFHAWIGGSSGSPLPVE